MEINKEQYATVIVYGIGQYYEKIKKELFRHVKPDYLCDRKWDADGPDSYDDIPIIKREKLSEIEHSLIIIALKGVTYTSAKCDLQSLENVTVMHADSILEELKSITGKKLKELCPNGFYQDKYENRIYFDETLSDWIVICFEGRQNVLTVGRNVIAGNLRVTFGNKGTCSIGDGTEILEACFFVSGANLTIGRDCLLSSEVIIRNHDHHHIFDSNTHERINYPRDIIIGNHVWVGYRALILAGARIETGSVIGAAAVTSGQFGEHQVIAGCPAKVIREHVCWSKDNTDYFNHDILEECVSQEALKYL